MPKTKRNFGFPSPHSQVRINAALGLAAPPQRRGYGSCDMFTNVWVSLVTALETAENINDFAEYKYKDTLTEHVSDLVTDESAGIIESMNECDVI